MKDRKNSSFGRGKRPTSSRDDRPARGRGPDREGRGGERSGGRGDRDNDRPKKDWGDHPQRGERKSYSERGERKSYGDRPSRDGRDGDFKKRDFKRDDAPRGRDDGRPKKRFRDDDDRKAPFKGRGRDDRGSERGERKSYGDRGDRPSRDSGRGGPRGERKTYERGERKPYGDRPSRDSGRGERGDRDFKKRDYDRDAAPRGRRNDRYEDKPRRAPRDDSRGDSRPARSPRASAPRDEESAPRDTMRLRPGGRPSQRPSLFGFHAVEAAWLNPARNIHALYLTEAAMENFAPVLERAAKEGLNRPAPLAASKDDIDRLLPPGAVHQGIALACAPLEDVFVNDIIIRAEAQERSVIVLLDQVTDPHNVGAILRSACAFGAAGVVMQKMHAPELTGVLAKTACGAAEHLPVAYETNLSRTLETLKEAGYVAIGLDERGEETLADIAGPEKCVLVLGAEGPGMRRLVRENCDILARLPTREPIASLNVSNAAAVALYALLA